MSRARTPPASRSRAHDNACPARRSPGMRGSPHPLKGEPSMSSMRNAFGARDTLSAAASSYAYYRLDALTGQTNLPLDRLPFTVRILLENALRMTDLEPGLVNE